MQVVILAGGFGTRLEEETLITPKPLVRVGDYPILWHIMKIYGHYKFNDFIICLGYKGQMVKEYFCNYFLYHSDVTFDFSNGEKRMEIHSIKAEPWKVTLVDTGLNTQTGGRIRKVASYIKSDDFMLTYGDGVADVNIQALLEQHKKAQTLCTVTAVKPPGKFGILDVDKEDGSCPVREFTEKPTGDGGWISGGFFVVNRKVFDYIDGDQTIWEHEPLQKLTREQQLMPYFHRGFWQCMDTIRHKRELEALWNSGNPPWKCW